MKLGYITACLPNLNLEELVKWSSDAGFDTLELAAWPIDSSRDYQARQIDAANFTKSEASKVREIFETNGMEISALAYYDNNLHPNRELRNSYITHLKKVIETASLLGVELVGTFVGGNPELSPGKNISEIGKIFGDILKFAEDRGVKIMIENCPMENWVKFGLPGNYAYSPELWSAIFNEVQSDNFGLNFDPSHLYWLGIDHIQAAVDFADKIFHAHAKDTEIIDSGIYKYGIFGRQVEPIPWKSGWWRYRMPGWGEIDWQKFISVLQENGYDKVLSIEHEDPVWEGTEEKIKSGLKLGLKHLSQFIIK